MGKQQKLGPVLCVEAKGVQAMVTSRRKGYCRGDETSAEITVAARSGAGQVAEGSEEGGVAFWLERSEKVL